MEPDQQIKEFLIQQRALQVESEGCFTLAPEKALHKMAQFSLPGANWWAAKVVQAAVAGGLQQEIVISSQGSGMEVRFPLVCPSMASIREAFLTPSQSKDPVLKELIPALWSIGPGAGATFRLSAGEASMTFDGDRVTASGSGPCSGPACLSIEGLELSSDFITELKHLCCACPLPLRIEGQRVDNLLHCAATEGDGYTLAVGFADSDAPELGLPPGLFKRGRFTRISPGIGLDNVAVAAKLTIASLPARTSAPLPYLLHRNREWVQTGGGYHTFKLKEELSTVYWVSHGVIVDQEPLGKELSEVSVIAFANAEGLPTDLTGIRLLDGEPRQALLGKLRRALACDLASLDCLSALQKSCYSNGSRLGCWAQLLAIFPVLIGSFCLHVGELYQGLAFLASSPLPILFGSASKPGKTALIDEHKRILAPLVRELSK